MTASIHNHGGIHLKLLNEELHRPENAKTDAQKFVVYHHLYWQRVWYLFRNREIDIVPPMQTIYVEGLPGVGKTFVINTLRNIIKIIAGKNDADAASAPTGCAAALIDGSTHARLMSIPVGKKAVKAPTNMVTTNANKLKHMKKMCSVLVARLMDEHSMMGLQDWAWAKHRNEELRRPSPPVMDEEFNEVSVNQNNVNLNEPDNTTFILDENTRMRQWGGIPFIYSFGDTNQLPPVAKRSTYDTRPPKQGADRLGKFAFHEFINTTDGSESISTVVVMEDVLRQSDEIFKTLLQNMRQGNMDDNDIDIMFSRVIHNLPDDEKQQFLSEGLHLVPTWKEANAINLEYIKTNLNTPIARYEAKMNTCKTNGKNCCISECNFPLRSLLCVGAKVMLLDNSIVEYKLMNGSVGVVKDLCFSNPEGTPDDNMYVVVDFSESTIPDEQKVITDMPSTYVPIPLVTRRCERNCCSMTAIPLQVCKALSIHKSQGMTVGEGKQFQKVIVYLPLNGNKCPGMELVATSRAVELNDFAIGNSLTQLTRQDLLKIGRTPAYNARRDFLKNIRNKSVPSQQQTRLAITALHQNATIHTDKTFEGGCNFLLD